MTNNLAKKCLYCVTEKNNCEILAYWEHPFLKAGQYAPSQPCLWMINPGHRRPLYFTSRFHFDFNLFWFYIFLINTLALEHDKLKQKCFFTVPHHCTNQSNFLHTLVVK